MNAGEYEQKKTNGHVKTLTLSQTNIYDLAPFPRPTLIIKVQHSKEHLSGKIRDGEWFPQ